eukprot:UN30370
MVKSRSLSKCKKYLSVVYFKNLYPDDDSHVNQRWSIQVYSVEPRALWNPTYKPRYVWQFDIPGGHEITSVAITDCALFFARRLQTTMFNTIYHDFTDTSIFTNDNDVGTTCEEKSWDSNINVYHWTSNAERTKLHTNPGPTAYQAPYIHTELLYPYPDKNSEDINLFLLEKRASHELYEYHGHIFKGLDSKCKFNNQNEEIEVEVEEKAEDRIEGLLKEISKKSEGG